MNNQYGQSIVFESYDSEKGFFFELRKKTCETIFPTKVPLRKIELVPYQKYVEKGMASSSCEVSGGSVTGVSFKVRVLNDLGSKYEEKNWHLSSDANSNCTFVNLMEIYFDGNRKPIVIRALFEKKQISLQLVDNNYSGLWSNKITFWNEYTSKNDLKFRLFLIHGGSQSFLGLKYEEPEEPEIDLADFFSIEPSEPDEKKVA